MATRRRNHKVNILKLVGKMLWLIKWSQLTLITFLLQPKINFFPHTQRREAALLCFDAHWVLQLVSGADFLRVAPDILTLICVSCRVRMRSTSMNPVDDIRLITAEWHHGRGTALLFGNRWFHRVGWKLLLLWLLTSPSVTADDCPLTHHMASLTRHLTFTMWLYYK